MHVQARAKGIHRIFRPCKQWDGKPFLVERLQHMIADEEIHLIDSGVHHFLRHRGHLTDLTGQRSTEAVGIQILGQRGEGEEENT